MPVHDPPAARFAPEDARHPQRSRYEFLATADFGSETLHVNQVGKFLHLLQRPAEAQAVDNLGLVQAVDRLRQGIVITPPVRLIPTFAVPIPGGGQTDLMANPLMAFATRFPGAPVETYSGPGSFINSGLLQKQTPPGAPPNQTMSVVFDTPGTYSYLCLIHTDRMFGTVEVVDPDADADTQATIDARAQSEIAAEMPLIEAARQEALPGKKEPGPNKSTSWYVRAGASEIFSGDGRGQVMEFLPKDVSVKAGDSVIWGSAYFHTVTFAPTAPAPEFILPRPSAAGPPTLVLNPMAIIPSKPTPTYEPARYCNSSDLGPFSQAGFSWSLSFDKPGTYEYVCLVHKDLGMKGTVTVVPK